MVRKVAVKLLMALDTGAMAAFPTTKEALLSWPAGGVGSPVKLMVAFPGVVTDWVEFRTGVEHVPWSSADKRCEW